MNEWAILKSELDVLMIYEEEAEAVAQVMYKCNFPSEVERWVWVGDSLLKELPFGAGGQPVPGWGQFDGQDQQGQQGQEPWQHPSARADAQLQQGLQQPQNTFTNQPQGVQTRMTPSLASRFKPWGTRTEVQGPGWETGPGTQQFHQANVKGGHGPQEYHDWVNEQYGEPQDGVGQRMGRALGRFGTWAGDKAKDAWGGAKNLGRKTARGFAGAGTYIDEMGGSMGRGLTGVWDAFGNARKKASQTMSDRAQIQGGHATAEEIQQERDKDRREELQGQQKTLADEIAAIGGGHGTGAGAPRGVPQRPEIPPAPLLDNLGGQIAPSPGAEEQPPAPAPLPPVAPDATPAPLPPVAPTGDVKVTPPQAAQTSPHEAGMAAAGMGDMGPATRRRFEAGGPDLRAEGSPTTLEGLSDEQLAQVQQQQGTVDDMLAGNPWSREQHHSANQGPSSAFSEKSYNQLAAKNRPPEGQNVFDATTPLPPVAGKKEDEPPLPPEYDSEGRGYSDLSRKEYDLLTSSDSFTHAWDYLLKGA